MGVELVKNACPACAAELEFRVTALTVGCGYCGSSFRVERSGSTWSLELAKAQNQLELARTALANKNGGEALALSNRCLEGDPSNAEAWVIKGAATAYLANGNNAEVRFHEAMSCLDRAASLNPEMPEVAMRREEMTKLMSNYCCILGKNLWTQAVKIASRAMSAGTGGYAAAGDLPEKAIAQYERALSIWPDNATALKSIVHIRKETGRVEAANAHIEKLRALDPSFAPPSNRALPRAMDTMASLNQILGSIFSIVVALIMIMVAIKSCGR